MRPHSTTRRSARDADDGFTLIELMVVILIIAILLAIAIPTFLGARERAANRAAQTSLRTALVTAKTEFTGELAWPAVGADLAAIEPGLTWSAAPVLPTDRHTIVFIANSQNLPTDSCVEIHNHSTSGVNYAILDVAVTSGIGGPCEVAQPGTHYSVDGGSTWQTAW